MKKTPWFPASVKPVRKGWYQCSMCKEHHMWTGRRWMFGTSIPFSVSDLKGFKWRGILK